MAKRPASLPATDPLELMKSQELAGTPVDAGLALPAAAVAPPALVAPSPPEAVVEPGAPPGPPQPPPRVPDPPQFRVAKTRLVTMPMSHGGHRTQLREGQIITPFTHPVEFLKSQGLELVAV
jgi:hypothetical protein